MGILDQVATAVNEVGNATKSAGNKYQIQINSVSAGNEEQSMDYEEIMDKLHNMNPGDVQQAAAAFKKLGTTLDTVTEQLASAGNSLAQKWSGPAAAKAMAKFQQLHNQAAQLAAQAHTTSDTMNWVGSDVMPQFQSIPSPQVMGGGNPLEAAAGGAIGGLPGAGAGALLAESGKNKANTAARQYLSTLNQHLVQANSQLPASTAGPSDGGWDKSGGQHFNPGGSNPGGSNPGGSNPGGSNPGSGGGGGGGVGGGTPIPSAPTGGGHVNLAHMPSGDGSSSASLQGYAPPPGGGGSPVSPYGGGAPGGLAPGGGGSANPFARIPAVPGGIGNAGAAAEEGALGENALKGLGKGVPGESGLAAGAGKAGAAEGAAAEAGEAGAARAAGAAAGEAGGASGIPFTGAGGGGQKDKERQRQAWLEEDDDIWGVPDTDIGSIIG